MSNISSWNCWAWPPSKLGRHQTSTTSDVWFSTEQLVGASGRTTKADVIDITDVIGLFVCLFVSFFLLVVAPRRGRRGRLTRDGDGSGQSRRLLDEQSTRKSIKKEWDQRRTSLKDVEDAGLDLLADFVARPAQEAAVVAVRLRRVAHFTPVHFLQIPMDRVVPSFPKISIGFHWVWLRLTGLGRVWRGFYRVWMNRVEDRSSLGSTEFYWVSLGIYGFYLVSRSLDGLDWVLLGFTGFYWVLLGFTVFYLVLLRFNGFYRVLLGFPEFSWILLAFTRFY